MLELSEASVHHMFVNARAAVRVRRCGKKIASPDGAAWGRGVRFGRPRKLLSHRRRAAIERLDAGDSVVDVARTFGVDRATLYRMQAEAAQYTDQTTRLGARSAIGAPSARSQMPESLSQFVKSFARTF
jgi:hypothetical protein